MSQEKLVKLLQPKEYKSKIKLYCQNSNLEIQKFAQKENKDYLSRIKITEL